MSPDPLLYFKAELGQREIAKQNLLQSRPLRNVLLMVDGKRDVPALQALIASISAPQDALEQLLALGLIAAPVVAQAPPAAPAEPEPDVEASDSFLHDDDELPSELHLDTRSAVEHADPHADFSSLYQQLNALVSANLGMIKAYGMQLKIEQCQTADQLLALLPEIKAALVAKHGDAKAVALLRQLGQ